jgi:hypothetical protein
MPSYQLSPLNRVVQTAVPGLPAYFFGSLNRLVAPTRMKLTSGSILTNVATLVVTVIEGNIPVVGQLLTVFTTDNSNFNVTNVAIASVSAAAVPDAGVYTLTYAKTASNQPSVPLAGAAIAPQAETGETIANGASVPIALQANIGPNNGQDIRVDVTYPTVPTKFKVDVQTSMIDLDSEYVTLGTVSSVAGSSITGQAQMWADVRANFVRLNGSTLAGTGKIIAKLLV